MTQTVTIQVHIEGAWRDLATVTFLEPERGFRGQTKTVYSDDFFMAHAVEDFAAGASVRDCRAASVRLPVELDPVYLPHWPAFLIDMMPQGTGRQKIARRLGLRAEVPAAELPILLEAAGAPVGNLRVLEAADRERARLARQPCPGLDDRDLAERSERLVDIIDRFCPQWASGATAQGAWPKALLTRGGDGLWYPDPLVADQDATEHVIVKLLKTSSEADRRILEAEAPYLEVARAFGLQVARPLLWSGTGSLVIPRFDREVRADGVVRHGQESLFSALGVADNAVPLRHEDGLGLLREAVKVVSGKDTEPVTEYLARDVLNLAMGNPDNHGRNTALAKPAGGGIGLSPLFDFAPMSLADDRPARGTRWDCLQGRDLDPDWPLVCAAAAAYDPREAGRLRAFLLSLAPRLRDLPELALDLGVAREIVEGRAFARLGDVTAGLLRLDHWDPARNMEEMIDATKRCPGNAKRDARDTETGTPTPP